MSSPFRFFAAGADAPLLTDQGEIGRRYRRHRLAIMLAISYEKAGFTGRVGLNYHGKFLYELGETADEDIYYDNHIQWDFAASQKIVQGLQVYLQAINLNNEPLRYYIGDTARPVQREFYSWCLHAGLKYEL